jgi:hypothetical protein
MKQTGRSAKSLGENRLQLRFGKPKSDFSDIPWFDPPTKSFAARFALAQSLPAEVPYRILKIQYYFLPLVDVILVTFMATLRMPMLQTQEPRCHATDRPTVGKA